MLIILCISLVQTSQVLESFIYFMYIFLDCVLSVEVCVPECHSAGTGFFPKNSWKFFHPEHSGKSSYPSCSELRTIWWTNGFFPDFSEPQDHKEVVLSRSRQLGNCPPVSSCLVSFKTSLGTRTYN